MIARFRLSTDLYKPKIGTLLTNIILAVLILVPSINYFGKYVLLDLAGVAVNLRFLVLVCILGILAFSLVIGGMTTIPHQRVVGVCFVVWGTAIAIIQSVHIRWWLPPFMRWSVCILIALLGYHLASRGYLTPRKFRLGLILALVIPITLGVTQIATGAVPLLNGAYRVSSTFRDSPLGFALFLSGAIVILLSVESLRLINKVLLAVLLAMVVNTYARLILAALGIGIVFLFYLQRRIKNIFLIVLMVFLILPLLVLSNVIEQSINRFSTISLNPSVILDVWNEAQTMAYQAQWWRPDVDSSSLLRVKTLVIGLKAFQERPLQGHGFGSYVPYYEKVTGETNIAAHNDYILYLVETGVVGIVTYLILQGVIVVGLIRRSKLLNRETYFFAVSIAIAYLVVNVLSFLSNAYYFYEIQLWIWLGIGTSFALINTDRRRYLLYSNIAN